jgi:hypothetical protein
MYYLSELLSVMMVDKEAEELCRKALAERRKVLEENHEDTLSSLISLALLIRGKGDLTRAEVLYRRVLDRRAKVLGEYHISTLSSALIIDLML